jgi:large subunit ribosomal protein L15
MIKKIPKRRGFGKNRSRTVNPSAIVPAVVNLALLEKTFADGDAVTPKILIAKKLVRGQSGKLSAVKILAQGTLTKKLIVTGCTMSDTAKTAIEKAGGSTA